MIFININPVKNTNATINGSPVNPIDLRADAPLTAITVPKFVYPNML